jgi:hypothetical protein
LANVLPVTAAWDTSAFSAKASINTRPYSFVLAHAVKAHMATEFFEVPNHEWFPCTRVSVNPVTPAGESAGPQTVNEDDE